MEYKVLILEDNELDASLIERFLQRSEYNFETEWVTTGHDFEETIITYCPDVIISDYRLKNYSGEDAIRYKNIHCEEIPLIMVSGTIGEEKAVELIKKGATDFLIKNNISSRLDQTVVRAIKESLEREKRHKAELQLKSSDERFRMLFEQSMDGIFIGDPDKGQILTANDAASTLTGYSSSELRGMALEDFMDVETGSLAHNLADLKKEKFFRGDVYIKHKNGSRLPVDATRRLVHLKNGDRRSFYIIRDISERLMYEDQLKKEKAFTEKALNSLPGIFYMLDEDNNYIRINKNMEKELGYSWKEIKEMNPQDLFHKEDHPLINKKIKEAYDSGEASMIARLKDKYGQGSHYYITGAHFKQDESHYLLGTAIDISEQIEAQQRIKESLKEKETLLTEIHHRVKNNLAVVSGMMQLQAFSSEDETANQMLLNSVSRIKSIALIHEHLYQSESLSHIEIGNNLRELIQKIKSTFNYDLNINYEFDLQKIVLNVNQAVPFALIINEVITNIYKHAFKNRTGGNVCITLCNNHDTVDLKVEDDGVGLPEDFDLDGAESLGLSLINTLASQLQAQIEMYSEDSTIFHLTFDQREVSGSSNAL